MRRIGSVVFILLVTAFLAHAQDADFTISLDKNRVAKGKQATLSVSMPASAGKDTPRPDVEFIDGLNIRYQKAVTESAGVTHLYKVIPTRLGSFRIGPLFVTSGGNRLTSNSLLLESVEEAPELTQNIPTQGQTDITDRIFVRLAVPKNKFYTNERLPIELQLYSDWLDLENIAVEGISTDELVVGDFKKGRTRIEEMSGTRYAVLGYDSFLMAPSPGSFELPPVKVSFYIAKVRRQEGAPPPEMLNDNEVFYNSILRESEVVSRQLKTEPVRLEVVLMPSENAPKDFRGAVGSFSIEASVDPRKVKAGEPVTVKAIFTGRGNFNAITSLGLDSREEFKAYGARFTPGENKLTVEQVLRPLSSDVTEVPEITLSYFDPDKSEYMTARAGPFPIKVEGVVSQAQGFQLPVLKPKSEPKVEKKVEIIGDKKSARPPGRMADLFFFMSPGFKVIILLPLAVFLMALPVKRHLYKLETDANYARRLRSSRLAGKELPELGRLARSGQSKAFYDRAFLFIERYLGLGWKIEDEKIRAEIRKIYDDCYLARFTPQGMDKDDAAATFKAIKGIVARLVMVVSLFLALTAPAFAGDGDAYYNLGNEFFRKGDVGRAVLNYERARLFAPRDADLRANLRAARSLMKQKDPPQRGNWLGIGLDSLFKYFTLKETLFLAGTAYYILAVISLACIFFKKYRRSLKPVLITCALALVVMIFPIKNKASELESGAIITAAVTDAKYEPREASGTHFPLYEGMKVTVLKSGEGWKKIRRSDGRIGWISVGSAEPLCAGPTRP